MERLASFLKSTYTNLDLLAFYRCYEEERSDVRVTPRRTEREKLGEDRGDRDGGRADLSHSPPVHTV